MSEVEAAQAQIRQIVEELAGIRFRLLGVLATLPSAVADLDPGREIAEVELAEPETEVRVALQCVLQDHLDPVLQDLRRAASR